jgi:hypothetical protein
MEVLNKIKDGYIPLGGVSMAVDSGKISTFKYFVQAMVNIPDNCDFAAAEISKFN